MSARPSTVVSQVTVDLPRPRSQSVTRALPRFHELHEQVLGLVERNGAAR
ncbi:hypothetical protein GCM10023191_094190 [Actinoallomurus oryzae]|uniref:Uncharacterized protein n=1 Tax=Actinoallomurus oryzae TaxID=502180 RepID=A0ABP8R5V1_9ACTN